MTSTAEPPFPLPPDPLLTRVGRLTEDPRAIPGWWKEVGRKCSDMVRDVLPEDWSFDGKTVLDFGCGAGRTLRYFYEEAQRATFWGCDVHTPSIEWLDAHLSPPFRVVANDAVPPLPFDDETFDLVYCFSVFTHLTDTNAEWLLEIRRILKPDGYFFVTFHGPGMWELRGDAHLLPDLDVVGRSVWGQGRDFFSSTGPDTFTAGWWIREHWGRAFDILEMAEEGVPRPPIAELHGRGQGYVVMRPNGKPITPEEIDAPVLGDQRELDGLVADRALMLTEMGHIRHQATVAQAELDAIRGTKVWRYSAPLRAVRRLLARSKTP